MVLTNVKLLGEMLAIGAGAETPFPVSGTLCGDPAALSVIVRLPVRPPRAVGVNLTVIVQLTPAAKVAPHVVEEMEKSPEIERVMLNVAVPVLLNVTTWPEERTPRTTLPKSRLVGLKETTGAVAAVPVPVKGTV